MPFQLDTETPSAGLTPGHLRSPAIKLQARPVIVDGANSYIDEAERQAGLPYAVLCEIPEQRRGLLGPRHPDHSTSGKAPFEFGQVARETCGVLHEEVDEIETACRRHGLLRRDGGVIRKFWIVAWRGDDDRFLTFLPT